jgi:hypothetical protein
MADPHFRKASRRQIALKVRFRRADGRGALEESASTNDFGIGGAFVETERLLPVGTVLQLTLVAPSAWDPLELGGEVRWTSSTPGRPKGMGIEFRGITPVQSEALYALIQASGYEGQVP